MDSIIDQIKSILESKDMSASEFADLIGVKRANVSHVLSGRNKPSLEFVIKFCEAFREVDLNSLLLNKENNDASHSVLTNTSVPDDQSGRGKESFTVDVKDSKSEIERIVLFFKNGSFKEYKNNDIARIL